jgi:hypothetical protein
MTINGNYSSPVTVNGFSCKNCTDVDYAKKHIDPAHPKDGPYGVNAKALKPGELKIDPTDAVAGNANKPVIAFGGQLAALAATLNSSTTPSSTQGHRVDVSV